MPNRDGNGPCGMGPSMGRGWGGWNRFNLFVNKPRGRKITIFAAIAPLVGALIKDITNPDGVLSFLVKRLLDQKKTLSRSKEINASYTIISEDNIKQENKISN